jgi:hypothetical protein
MATINLGSIKFNWKGAYAGGTAYVVDDVVSYNGSSYVCILASTGNLPTNATYFEQMSSAGTNGTDGTDLTTTLTTQGDIVYRDASGLARLGAGTSGQVLQTGGTGANPSWTNVSSDFVKLTSGNFGASSSISIDGFYSSDYSNYKLYLYNLENSNQQTRARFNFGGSPATSSDYRTVSDGAQNAAGSGNYAQGVAEWGVDHINLTNWGATNGYGDICIIDIIDPQTTGFYKRIQYQISTYFSTENQVLNGHAIYVTNDSVASTGITIFSSGGNTYPSTSKYALYGIK